MKKQHKAQLKFHTWFTLGLAVVSLLIMLLIPDWTLLTVLLFLVLFVGGNGLLHVKAKTLTRDILIEYVLVAVVALVVLIGAVGTSF